MWQVQIPMIKATSLPVCRRASVHGTILVKQRIMSELYPVANDLHTNKLKHKVMCITCKFCLIMCDSTSGIDTRRFSGCSRIMLGCFGKSLDAGVCSLCENYASVLHCLPFFPGHAVHVKTFVATCQLLSGNWFNADSIRLQVQPAEALTNHTVDMHWKLQPTWCRDGVKLNACAPPQIFLAFVWAMLFVPAST